VQATAADPYGRQPFVKVLEAVAVVVDPEVTA